MPFSKVGLHLPAGSVEEETDFGNDNRENSGSLLWGYGGISVLPHGNYPVLAALSEACLQSKPPLTDRWLDIMEGHLSRTESSSVWTAMYKFLRWLHLADHGRAQAFLDQLFLSYPSILNSLEGTRLLAECQRWIDPDSAQSWLDRMLTDGDEAAAQGMGELLVFRLALFLDEPWIAKRLDYLINVARLDDKLLSARIGVAHSVAHLWREPQHRKLMHGYVMILLQDQDKVVLDAIADIFRSRRLFPDSESRELLDKICDYPTILRHQRSESIGECLETIVLTEPDLVYKVCETLLDLAGPDMADIGASGYLMSDSLVSIALTLHDLGVSYQALGTALFERMLEFNVPEARDLLFFLDKRTPQQASFTSRRRRWRRTQNKKEKLRY